MKRYGDSLYIANSEGLYDTITFRETISNILRDYFNRPNKNDEVAHNRAMIAAAVKFIKSDIKAYVKSTMDAYLQTDKLSLESSFEYLLPAFALCFSICLLKKTPVRNKLVLDKPLFSLGLY